jgi:hypothetical protein
MERRSANHSHRQRQRKGRVLSERGFLRQPEAANVLAKKIAAIADIARRYREKCIANKGLS